jgi:hypothetical protein
MCQFDFGSPAEDDIENDMNTNEREDAPDDDGSRTDDSGIAETMNTYVGESVTSSNYPFRTKRGRR